MKENSHKNPRPVWSTIAGTGPNNCEVSCPKSSVRSSDSEATGHNRPEMSSAGLWRHRYTINGQIWRMEAPILAGMGYELDPVWLDMYYEIHFSRLDADLVTKRGTPDWYHSCHNPIGNLFHKIRSGHRSITSSASDSSLLEFVHFINFVIIIIFCNNLGQIGSRVLNFYAVSSLIYAHKAPDFTSSQNILTFV